MLVNTTDTRFSSIVLLCTSQLAKATGEIIWIGKHFLSFCVIKDGQSTSVISWSVLSILVFFYFCQLQKDQGKYGKSLHGLGLECWNTFRFEIGLLVALQEQTVFRCICINWPIANLLPTICSICNCCCFPIYAVQKSELIWYCLTVLPGLVFSHFEAS